ncbi:MAG: MerR family transcriptional regulator [Deltaproteobacteria bacterium]|nr:MerR family transcriptional regulator [Deltaproteobacteria bacterium]
MELRVAELAHAAGVGVDTVRFYQARGLLAPPLRRGRFAIYTGDHLERLRRIRALLDSGFSLAQIRRLLDADATSPAPGARRATGGTRGGAREDSNSLLASLAERSVGAGTLTQRELAEETGVPEALVAAAVRAGLLTPIEIDGEPRFPRSDLDMVAAGLAVLGEGLPLERLLELATQHASAIASLAEQAIDLFDDHVRKPRGEDEGAVRRAFERLLPQATQIVALHFQRTLVARALARLREKGESGALEETLALARSGRLEVQWR